MSPIDFDFAETSVSKEERFCQKTFCPEPNFAKTRFCQKPEYTVKRLRGYTRFYKNKRFRHNRDIAKKNDFAKRFESFAKILPHNESLYAKIAALVSESHGRHFEFVPIKPLSYFVGCFIFLVFHDQIMYVFYSLLMLCLISAARTPFLSARVVARSASPLPKAFLFLRLINFIFPR